MLHLIILFFLSFCTCLFGPDSEYILFFTESQQHFIFSLEIKTIFSKITIPQWELNGRPLTA